MKVHLAKSDLQRALSLLQSVVQKKTTMPVLSQVLMVAENGQLRISATDLEVTAVISLPASFDSASEGSIAVSAKLLGDVVRELGSSDEVTLKVSEGMRLELLAGASRFKIIGTDPQEFPSLPGASLDASSRVKASELLDMLNKTLYAVSMDDTRFNLTGVCFEQGAKANTLRMVATDGHRLALVTRTIHGLTVPERVIVPRKGLSEIRKVLADEGDGFVGLEIKESFLVLQTKDTKIAMRLIDGEFPDYTQIIPNTKGSLATIPLAEFIHSLRRASLMVSDKGKYVQCDFSTGKVSISGASAELGEAQEVVEINYTGAPLSVGFNPRYLIDAASALGEEGDLVLELNGELGAGKIYLSADESALGIVMPMRL